MRLKPRAENQVPHIGVKSQTLGLALTLPGAFTENGLEVQQPHCDSCKTLALRRQLNMLKGNILCSFTETELKQVPASLPEDRMLSLSKVECYSDLKQTPRESETVHSWSGYKQKSG